jgi:uncharacterized protein YaaR (DUF327 family)
MNSYIATTKQSSTRRCIKQIFFTYYKIIKEIRVSLIEDVLSEEDKSLEMLNQLEESKRKATLGFGLSRWKSRPNRRKRS